jgi:O-6-methylguanine DNA methyltransferase
MNFELSDFKIAQIQENQEIPASPLSYNILQSRYGSVTIAKINNSLCWLGFGDNSEILKKRFKTDPIIDPGLKLDKTNKISIDGTPFQQRVWRSLITIPSGKTVSYKDIANDIGAPKAVRAVGSAIGKNPISILIPCHRVLRSDGGIGGYLWGTEMKQRLLDDEGYNPKTSRML